MNIVWFKRDLRIVDHDALSLASASTDIIPLYIFEPELWQQADLSHRHFCFLRECLDELNQKLTQLGQPLIIRTGDAVNVLNTLVEHFPIKNLWSHQETWSYWTYQRDQRVATWARDKNIIWHQPRHNGVIRKLGNRDGWSKRWLNHMKKPLSETPSHLKPVTLDSDLPSFSRTEIC